MDTLTTQELDVLSGMFIVFLHAAERCLTLTERHYEAEYRQSKEYLKLCKTYGKAKADEMLGATVKKIVRGDQKNCIRSLLEVAHTYKQRMEKLTEIAALSHNDDVTFMQSFDALQHDTNYLCHLYALIINCEGKDDELKIESTIKTLAKGKRCSQNVIDKFTNN